MRRGDEREGKRRWERKGRGGREEQKIDQKRRRV